MREARAAEALTGGYDKDTSVGASAFVDLVMVIARAGLDTGC
jgi:hypothetical protein